MSSMYFSTVETRSIKLDERLSEKVNVVVSGAGGKVGLGISISLAIYNHESTVNSIVQTNLHFFSETMFSSSTNFLLN